MQAERRVNKMNLLLKELICILIIVSVVFSFASCNKTDKNDSLPPSQTQESADKTRVSFDPFSEDNIYDIGDNIINKQKGTDYGKIEKDIKYYSTTAEDYKECNVLLPPGYDKNSRYPVMYVIHGWGGNHTNQISRDSYLQLVYGNMLRENLTVPMIIVNVDMYTDKQDEKDSKEGYALRAAYDKVIDDIAIDLMPFIERRYPVLTGRKKTAVAGVSQGASEALATGFKWLDKIGYIGSFAPDPGVIPTEFYKGTYWNVPTFDDFPQPDENNMPEYLYLAVGSNDPWNVDVTLYYRDVLNSKGIKNQTDLVPGFEHNYIFWRVCFYNFLSKIFR